MPNCLAKLFIADDYGDNTSTMRCQLWEGHEGPHLESFVRDGKITITWEKDETPFSETWTLDNKDLILKNYLNILNDRDNNYIFAVDVSTGKILRIEDGASVFDKPCDKPFDNMSYAEFIWSDEIRTVLCEHGCM